MLVNRHSTELLYFTILETPAIIIKVIESTRIVNTAEMKHKSAERTNNKYQSSEATLFIKLTSTHKSMSFITFT